MPNSKLEWTLVLLALAGALVIGLLLGIDGFSNSRSGEQEGLPTSASPSTVGASTTTVTTSPPEAGSVPARTSTDQTTSSPSRPPAAATTQPSTSVPAVSSAATRRSSRSLVHLRLTARADTWLSARRLTSAGLVLFDGILPQSKVLTVTSQRIWVRFGAAANVIAELNGRPVRLQPGTYSALITARGITPLSP